MAAFLRCSSAEVESRVAHTTPLGDHHFYRPYLQAEATYWNDVAAQSPLGSVAARLATLCAMAGRSIFSRPMFLRTLEDSQAYNAWPEYFVNAERHRRHGLRLLAVSLLAREVGCAPDKPADELPAIVTRTTTSADGKKTRRGIALGVSLTDGVRLFGRGTLRNPPSDTPPRYQHESLPLFASLLPVREYSPENGDCRLIVPVVPAMAAFSDESAAALAQLPSSL